MTTAVLLANDFAHCAKPVMFGSLLPFVATKYGTDFECSRHLQQILVNVFCLSHNPFKANVSWLLQLQIWLNERFVSVRKERHEESSIRSEKITVQPNATAMWDRVKGNRRYGVMYDRFSKLLHNGSFVFHSIRKWFRSRKRTCLQAMPSSPKQGSSRVSRI